MKSEPGEAAVKSADRALAMADSHSPEFARYLWWFLQERAINASRPEAPARILAVVYAPF